MTAESVSTVAATTPANVPQQGLISSVTLIVGPSGSGKSSLCATAAEYVWEHFQKWTAYYLFDNGGVPTQVQSLANKGIIRLWRVRTRSGEHLAPETIYRAAQGYWPRRINPLTGQVDPTIELIAPVTETIECYCPAGHLIKTVRFQSQLVPGTCPTCKTLVNNTSWKLVRSTKITRGFENRGACVFDSIPGANSWLLGDLAKRSLGGENSRLGGVVESGSMRFGENNRAQVGFAQNSAEQWLGAANAIPNLVIPAIFTALVKEGELEGGIKLKGPDIGAGSAKTHVVPQWVGNCIEAAVTERDGKKWRQIRLNAYTDGDGFRHPLKVRAYPGYLPELLEDEDLGPESQEPRFVNFHLGTLHSMLDAARARYEAEVSAKYPNAPGLEGASEFGEEQGAPQGTAAAPAPVSQAAAPPPPPAARPAGSPMPAAGPRAAAPVGVQKPAAAAPVAAVTPPPAAQPKPSVAATGPQAPAPPPGRGPVRGPVAAAPPGRKPIPAAQPVKPSNIPY